MLDELEKLGFDIRDFGNNSVVIHGLPANISATPAGTKLEMMIEQFKTLSDDLNSGSNERIARAASRASAIEYGTQLTEIEMQEVVDQLFACANPNHSPSGKPIVKILELEDLDSYFKD